MKFKNVKIKKQILNKVLIIFLLVLTLNLSLVIAEAKFEVTDFSCSPSELIQGSIFSCTAQIQNTGDAAATLSTAYLYPDSNNWLESSVYTQSYGSSIGVGESVSITFTGLKATKAGTYGFSKTVLDNVEKTDYVSTTKVKIIDVVVTVNNSVTSSTMSGSFTSTATVIAGGNINVILTFTVDSGGCSIGNDSSQKTINGLQSGNTQSRTWIVTQGSSGDCKFTISAAATGSGTKIDSTPSTIACTNCPTGSGSTTSSGGGGSNSGGGITKTYILGELISTSAVEISGGERVIFNISKEPHTLSIKNITSSSAMITIESKKQTFIFMVGEEKNIDVNEDGNSDISLRLKSISLLTKKANLIFTRISGGTPSTAQSVEETPSAERPGAADEKPETKATARTENERKGSITLIFVLIVIFLILAIISAYYILKRRRER